MTEDKIALRALLEKGSDTTFLREMIGFAAERLMQLETETLCGAAPGERSADRLTSATATETATGRPGPGRSSCAYPSSAVAATFRHSSNPAGWPRRP